MLPAEIIDVVHETDRDIEYISDYPHYFLLIVAPGNPVSQIREICGERGQAGEPGARLPMSICSNIY